MVRTYDVVFMCTNVVLSVTRCLSLAPSLARVRAVSLSFCLSFLMLRALLPNILPICSACLCVCLYRCVCVTVSTTHGRRTCASSDLTHAYQWFMAHNMKREFHKYECFMAHIRKGRVTHMNELFFGFCLCLCFRLRLRLFASV